MSPSSTRYLLLILLIDRPQPVHQQIFVVLHPMAAIACDDRRRCTGSDNRRFLVRNHAADTVNNTVQHTGRTVDNAVAHTVLGVFADEILGMLQGNVR